MNISTNNEHFCKSHDLCCVRCGKSFQYPSLLKRHQNQKTTCVLILEKENLSETEQKKKYNCKFCGRRYTTYTSMCRHVRESCKIAPNEKNGEEGMELLYKHVKHEQKRNDRLENEMRVIKTQMGQLVNLLVTREEQNNAAEVSQAGNKTIAVQGDHNTTTQNHLEQNNTTINIFGQESVAHINYMTIYRLLNKIEPRYEVQDAAKTLLLEVMAQIYGNPDHPENFTSYLPNKRTDDTLVHGAKGWEIRSVQRTCQPMIEKGLDVLFEFSNQPLPDKPGCEDMEPRDKFERIYKILGESETKYPSELKNDTRAVLLQTRSLLRKERGGKLPKAGDE